MRTKLEAGEVLASLNVVHWRGVNIAGIARECGFDWLFIDLEHNSMDLDAAAQICVAALPLGITPIVRVPPHDQFLATRILDNGAMGVVAPHVDTAEQARSVVQNCKFPPLGRRSFTGPLAQLGFATPPPHEVMEAVNRNTMVIVMLESRRAIGNAEQIAAVEGVDGIMIGTNDLAAEMGIPGQFAHPEIERAYAATIAACTRHGKFPGMGGIYDHGLMEKFIGLGVRFLLGGSDVALMMAAGRARTAFLKGLHRGAVKPAKAPASPNSNGVYPERAISAT